MKDIFIPEPATTGSRIAAGDANYKQGIAVFNRDTNEFVGFVAKDDSNDLVIADVTDSTNTLGQYAETIKELMEKNPKFIFKQL